MSWACGFKGIFLHLIKFGFPIGSNSRSLSIFVSSPGIKVFATLCVCVCVSTHMVTRYISEVPSTLLIWVAAFLSLECSKWILSGLGSFLMVTVVLLRLWCPRLKLGWNLPLDMLISHGAQLNLWPWLVYFRDMLGYEVFQFSKSDRDKTVMLWSVIGLFSYNIKDQGVFWW